MAQIVEAGGEYLWTIQGNQARTEWALQRLFMNEVCNLKKGAPLSQHCQMASRVHKGHGRIEKRIILVSAALNDYLDWPYVAQVFRLEQATWDAKRQRRTRQVVCGLASLPPQQASLRRLLALTRQHWGIESCLHYRRDVTLHEDATRLARGSSGHNMAILNTLVIGLCLRHGCKNIARARRLFSAYPPTNSAVDRFLYQSFLVKAVNHQRVRVDTEEENVIM